ncbi:hypothetical protein C800_00223 [Phocaeicola vulgatus dnLKV7]|uniref:Uncharacterized protein n=1 Tax=Phocaeicola vulgatus dnLKV7 TaxID=1235786 RepID=R9HR33_PHOVU|nr:hypothetical protein C800_00223 [Phocaeicola vulgatus dnLKV7]
MHIEVNQALLQNHNNFILVYNTQYLSNALLK